MSSSSFYTQTFEEAATSLNTQIDRGLSSEQVKQRPKQFPHAPTSGSFIIFRIIWNQLKGGVILVLFIAMIASLFLGERENAIGIGLSILLSALFGFLIDFKAERALQALKNLNSPLAHVLREGTELEIPTSDLRVGDICILHSGARVPADGRLALVQDFQVDESMLTGESLPVKKNSDPLPPGRPLSDQTNMVFSGTTVTSGYAKAIVTALGEESELGRIGRLVEGREKEETPLQKQTEQLGRQLTIIFILLSALIVILGLLRNHSLLIMIETGIILAIAAIPESLPAITTVALAAGVHRMAKIHALVRHLPSVETLGTVSVICTDKTGTLTENNMRVIRIVTLDKDIDVSGSGYNPCGEFRQRGMVITPNSDTALRSLFRVAQICNNAKLESHDGYGWHIHGSSTEGALLVMASKANIPPEDKPDNFTRVKEFAFNSELKRMTVIARQKDGTLWSFTKGSPEEILNRCKVVLSDGKEVLISDKIRSHLSQMSHLLGQDGFRVLALAQKRLASENEINTAEEDLTWIGQVGIMDPPRTEVKSAIFELHSAGIRTVMITGDHKTTSMAIGRALGLFKEGDLCLNSNEIAEYTNQRRWSDLRNTSIFARVTPEDKLSIVDALKEAGHYVAMAGDGINDAPALKAADIGVAMGSQCADVAKEASDLVVTDGSYATIPAAVKEGRKIYFNIRRAAQYLLLCSFSTIGVMLFSILSNLPLPMNPLQILWLNLAVHIFPGLALAFVEAEPNLMAQRPRDPKERLLPWRSMAWVALRSLVVVGAGIWLYASEQDTGHTIHAQSLLMAGLALVLLFQTFSGLSETKSFLSMTRSLTLTLWVALASGLAIQFMATQWKAMHPILGTVTLSVSDFIRILTLAFAALLLVETIKFLIVKSRSSYKEAINHI